MYSGHNPSAIRSRDMIVDAMFQLLKTIPFTKINIRLLTDTANVSRQTFYSIFVSREEVIQYRLQVIFQEYEVALNGLPLTLHSLATLFFQFYQAHAELFNTLLDNHLDELLTVNARECMQALKLTDSATQSYTNGFIAAGLTQLLSDWHLKQDVPLSELVTLTEQLLNAATITRTQ
ncbi:TetR/AcrR family transcriptional regulator [Agrilactobacillus yilanensis]|uniref:TetR/AcrR family transcriptional regulator n=1 Tax=Agrilactobacillus yilanensis TaxID=2485997 RepID=A0ABW4J9N7_9LACO|nr:TetR/AcrR family transcriptional regulator [Agrilactobacillus yilanensis]